MSENIVSDNFSECEQFTGRKRAICRGEAGLPLYGPHSTNRYRESWGLTPLSVNSKLGATHAVVSGPRWPNSGSRNRFPGGVGTELKKLLSWFGQYADAGCNCTKHAANMDLHGIVWCERNIHTILGWLSEEAARRKVLGFSIDQVPGFEFVAKTVIELAIANANVNAEQFSRLRSGPRTAQMLDADPVAQRTRHCLDVEPTPDGPLQFRRQTCAACVENIDGTCRLSGGDIAELVVRQCEQCPVQKWFRHKPARVPFTSPIKTNMLYFVWPFAGKGAWQRNLDLLKPHLGLFNGQRIMAIAVSDETDSAEMVQNYMAGCGFEFMVVQNDKKLRDVVSFVPLLERVASMDPNELTFYAHAKGQRHGPVDDPSTTVHRWTAAQYPPCLNDWPAIVDAMESHAIAGPFKRYANDGQGGVFPGKNFGWHFSSTFFWLRHSMVFNREHWRHVDQAFWGCESWPGLHFHPDEAACLFHDFTKQLYSMPYFNETVQPEIDRWTAARGPKS